MGPGGPHPSFPYPCAAGRSILLHALVWDAGISLRYKFHQKPGPISDNERVLDDCVHCCKHRLDGLSGLLSEFDNVMRAFKDKAHDPLDMNDRCPCVACVCDRGLARYIAAVKLAYLRLGGGMYLQTVPNEWVHACV